MKEIEKLHLKAIRLATELQTTLTQLRSLAFEEATVDTQENVASLADDAETLRSRLLEHPVVVA